MRVARISAVLLTAILVMGTLGASAGATVPDAKTVSASKWVKAVCAAETKVHAPFMRELNAAQAAVKAGDAAAAKTAFATLIDALPGPTKTLLSSLKKAGVPKVTNGKKIAQTYVNAVQAIAKALPGVKTKVAALPTRKLAAFNTARRAATTAVDKLQTAGNRKVVTLDTDRMVNIPLQACGGVFAVGGSGSGGGQSGAGQGGSTPPPNGQGGMPPVS